MRADSGGAARNFAPAAGVRDRGSAAVRQQPCLSAFRGFRGGGGGGRREFVTTLALESVQRGLCWAGLAGRGGLIAEGCGVL